MSAARPGSDDLRRRLLDASREILREPDTPLELRKVAEERGWEMAGCDRTGRDGEYSSAAPFAPR